MPNRDMISSLREMSEENFCEDCFQKYKDLIEPKIKYWLAVPLIDWKKIDLEVTQLVMKNKGIFKKETTFVEVNEEDDERYADEVDGKAFRRTQRWSFKKKIDYLRHEGTLQDASYEVLDKARELRNRMHDFYFGFSDSDYLFLNLVHKVIAPIYTAIIDRKNCGNETSIVLRNAAEHVAERVLEFWEKELATK